MHYFCRKICTFAAEYGYTRADIFTDKWNDNDDEKNETMGDVRHRLQRNGADGVYVERGQRWDEG